MQDQFKFNSILRSITTICFIITGYYIIWLFCTFSAKITSSLLKSTEQIHEIKEELDQMLENLEESIIIISNDRVEFLNQRFIFYFGIYMFSQIAQQSTMRFNSLDEKAPRLSCISKFKATLKSLFSGKEEIIST